MASLLKGRSARKPLQGPWNRLQMRKTRENFVLTQKITRNVRERIEQREDRQTRQIHVAL
jgi:hypothetical protein